RTGARRLPGGHDRRVGQVAVPADERVAVAVVPQRRPVRREEVGGGPEDRTDEDGAGTLIEARRDDVPGPVDVVLVHDGVREGELQVAEGTQGARPVADVLQREYPRLDRARVVGRRRWHEVEAAGPDAGALGGDPGIPRAVPALVRVEWRLDRLPGG